MRPNILACLMIEIIILADQFSKWFVIEIILKGDLGLQQKGFWPWLITFPQDALGFVQMKITNFFNLVMVWNKGVNYFMPGDIQAAPLIMAGISCLLVIGLYIWMLRASEKTLIFGLAAIIGGATSNIWDRVRFGGVGDFLDFHIYGWHWPAFNLADSAIVLGVAVILIDSVLLEPRRKKQLAG